jgi:hypothetical protein
MSTHPNVILMAVLIPDGLSRKTMRDILTEYLADDDGNIKIGNEEYHSLVMESDYEDSNQIAAKEGDLVFYDLVTYGYGEVIFWGDLEKRKVELEKWAQTVCVKHRCKFDIRVTANYW